MMYQLSAIYINVYVGVTDQNKIERAIAIAYSHVM